MKRGEAVVLSLIGLMVVGAAIRSFISWRSDPTPDRGIPFYSTAEPALARRAADIYREQGCSQCHTLWTVHNMMESVPAPALDGIGSLRSEEWFYTYLSAVDPQSILQSRLKREYRMPSYAGLSQDDRRTLAQYLSSLKVKDWYLDEARAAEYEKLTGKAYSASHETH